jgi:hypothetical protein
MRSSQSFNASSCIPNPAETKESTGMPWHVKKKRHHHVVIFDLIFEIQMGFVFKKHNGNF